MSSGSARRPLGLVRAERGQRLLGVAQARHRGVGDPGRDGVDADAVRGELAGHAAGESHDAKLARHVGGGTHRAAVRRARREVDDHPGRPAATMRRAASWEQTNVALRLVSSTASHCSSVSSRNGRPGEDAGVVHEDVDRTQAALGLVPRGVALPRASTMSAAIVVARRPSAAISAAADFAAGLSSRKLSATSAPGLGEAERNGAADAALGARDEDDLSGAPLPTTHDGQRCTTTRLGPEPAAPG